MIGFTPSGGELFNVPNDTPQIATSDNGVVASSTSGQYVQFDQAGNVISQMPCQNPTVSWTNNVYQMAPVIQVSCPAPGSSPPSPVSPAAPPYANFAGANPSANATSAICQNESLTLVLEYTTFDFAYPPYCGEFKSQSRDPKPALDFSFTALNVDESKYNHYPDWGLLPSRC